MLSVCLASKSTGQNHPCLPSSRETAQKTVGRLAVIQLPQSTDVKTEAPRADNWLAQHLTASWPVNDSATTMRAPLRPGTEPGARDTGGDKKQGTATLPKLTMSEWRRQRAPKWLKRQAGQPQRCSIPEKEMKQGDGVSEAGRGGLWGEAAVLGGKQGS